MKTFKQHIKASEYQIFQTLWRSKHPIKEQKYQPDYNKPDYDPRNIHMPKGQEHEHKSSIDTDDLDEKLQHHYHKFNGDHAAAIKDYTGDGSRPLNHHLVKKGEAGAPHDKRYNTKIQHLDSAMKAHTKHKTPHPAQIDNNGHQTTR